MCPLSIRLSKAGQVDDKSNYKKTTKSCDLFANLALKFQTNLIKLNIFCLSIWKVLMQFNEALDSLWRISSNNGLRKYQM